MLRRLATELDVHVCLVVHPKKVDDDTQLSAGSIFGSAKISQEADNVMILQKSAEVPNYRILQLVKNRFDGEVGQAGLGFNKDTKRYFELTKIERDLLARENGDVTKILEKRQEKYNCPEPFWEEQKRQKQEADPDDKRRLMMKDKLELTRQMNLSKMVKQVHCDLDLYSAHKKTQPSLAEEEQPVGNCYFPKSSCSDDDKLVTEPADFEVEVDESPSKLDSFFDEVALEDLQSRKNPFFTPFNKPKSQDQLASVLISDSGDLDPTQTLCYTPSLDSGSENV